MAKKAIADDAVVQNTEQEAVQKESKKTESIYSVDELAECASKVFGSKVRSECVTAAFKSAGKDTATVEEAIEIVEAFMKKEVK